MTIDKVEVLLLTFLFVVPGFIIHSILSLCVPRRQEAKELLLLRFLVFSAINFTCFLPLIIVGADTHFVARHPIYSWIIFCGMVLVWPVVLGLVFAFIDKKQLVALGLKKLKNNPMHPVPNAWDVKFANAKGEWMLITLNDGETFSGFFGDGAIASSDPDERDIFLREYRVKVRGNRFVCPPDSRGILLSKDSIKHIQFQCATKKEQQHG